MKILFITLFVLGLISYLVSLYFFNGVKGELFSDIGNGIMLTDAVLILIFLVHKRETK